MKKIDKMWKYVIYTYLLFWFMVLGIGGIAIFMLNASDFSMRWVITLCSWSPTIVLLLMLKKLNPDTSIWEFYKKAFKEKLNFRVFALVMLVIVGIFLLSVWTLSVFEKQEISAQLSFVSATLFGNILFTAIQGASGEESGWRAYLMPEMESRYGFVRGNLILGLVWSFWHLPLWFVSTNYNGLLLLIYIFSFIIGLTSFSMIIGVCMKKCNNLFLAFWMHFLFNFVLTFFTGQDIYLLSSLAILYVLVATIFVAVYLKKSNLYRLEDKNISNI
ncbi:CPBP family intramembrane glutamic endopeptidase [Desulfitobacterium metallireducens]|uniref:Abortive infection protein n=1 Tax=Desulfitobacterium metallireducens DSM 15288 TaxID=871968 RepID=W0EAD1_9FIRM|nr:type II CAAX endopeptidase family protein [Desulfitobacterium metallireducens]AHF06026.1 abortive infection protein [Desulfitobacterium metallireducens DSM 15288]